MLSETDIRRRRLRFRAWHRGMREMDLLMGKFADAEIAAFDSGELSSFEELLELPDQEVFAWLTGQAPVPQAHDSTLLRRLRQFHDAHPLLA